MARDNVHVFARLDDFREFVVSRLASDPTETYQLKAHYDATNRQFDVELQRTGEGWSWRPFMVKLTFERATEMYSAWKKNKYDCPVGVRTLPGILAMLGETGDVKAEAQQLKAERQRLESEARDRSVRTYLAPFARQTAEDLQRRMNGLLPEGRDELVHHINVAVDVLNAIAKLTEGL